MRSSTGEKLSINLCISHQGHGHTFDQPSAGLSLLVGELTTEAHRYLYVPYLKLLGYSSDENEDVML
jgi:hypothetical protein